MINVETDLGPFVSLLLNSLLLRSLHSGVNVIEAIDLDELPQNLVCQLRIIILFRDNMEKLCHWFGKMLEVGKILDN